MLTSVIQMSLLNGIKQQYLLTGGVKEHCDAAVLRANEMKKYIYRSRRERCRVLFYEGAVING